MFCQSFISETQWTQQWEDAIWMQDSCAIPAGASSKAPHPTRRPAIFTGKWWHVFSFGSSVMILRPRVLCGLNMFEMYVPMASVLFSKFCIGWDIFRSLKLGSEANRLLRLPAILVHVCFRHPWAKGQVLTHDARHLPSQQSKSRTNRATECLLSIGAGWSKVCVSWYQHWSPPRLIQRKTEAAIRLLE